MPSASDDDDDDDDDGFDNAPRGGHGWLQPAHEEGRRARYVHVLGGGQQVQAAHHQVGRDRAPGVVRRVQPSEQGRRREPEVGHRAAAGRLLRSFAQDIGHLELGGNSYDTTINYDGMRKN